MGYVWDAGKNVANQIKHGISFEEACLIFEGDVLTGVDSRRDYGETRRISIGAIQGLIVITVVHTDRDGVIRIISARLANRKKGRSIMTISAARLKELQSRSDADIDYSDIPELDDAFFETAELVTPSAKTQITVRVDSEVLEWFRQQGKGYQTRMNAVLKAYMESQRRRSR
jgi:uncharacterized DUF497 family protein